MKITYAEEKTLLPSPRQKPPAFRRQKRQPSRNLSNGSRYYGNHFWLLYDADKLIAFVDGFVTDEPDLTDTMYENACMHNENGAWQMIFGVNTPAGVPQTRLCL